MIFKKARKSYYKWDFGGHVIPLLKHMKRSAIHGPPEAAAVGEIGVGAAEKKSNALEDLPPHLRGRSERSTVLNRCSFIPQTRWARF